MGKLLREIACIGVLQEAVALVLIAVLIATLGEKLWTAWVVAIILCFYTGSFNASWSVACSSRVHARHSVLIWAPGSSCSLRAHCMNGKQTAAPLPGRHCAHKTRESMRSQYAAGCPSDRTSSSMMLMCAQGALDMALLLGDSASRNQGGRAEPEHAVVDDPGLRGRPDLSHHAVCAGVGPVSPPVSVHITSMHAAVASSRLHAVSGVAAGYLSQLNHRCPPVC